MEWFLYGLLAQASASVAVFIDKYILESHLKDYAIVAVTTGFISFLIGFSIFILRGFPIFPLVDTVIAVTCGMLLFGYLLPYMKAIDYDDPSRVVPLFQLTPVFALIISYLFFGDVLSGTQLIGFFLVFVSGLILSIESDTKKIFSLRPAFWYMTLASLLLAIALILFDLVVDHQPFWDTFTYTSIGIGMGTLMVAAWPPYTKRLQKHLPEVTPRVWGAILTAEAFNFCYQLSYVYAVSLAAPALVALTEATQPAIVLLYGLVLTLLFPHIIKEDISRPILIRKLFAIALIVLGFYLIYI